MSVFVYSLENILSQIFSKNAHQAHDGTDHSSVSFLCVCVCVCTCFLLFGERNVSTM